MNSTGSGIKTSSAADKLTEASGSWITLWCFTAIQAFYLIWNAVPGVHHFDPYPFQFMTFMVSIIANYQTIIVMISQKGQLIRDRAQMKMIEQLLKTQIHLSEAIMEVLKDMERSDIKAAKQLEEILKELNEHR